MMARRKARQMMPALSDDSAFLAVARGAMGESRICFVVIYAEFPITIGGEFSASIACTFRHQLHKSQPRKRAPPPDFPDETGRFRWHRACMHLFS
jgi:hypothetical protein